MGKVLVLGAYGLIGAACVTALRARGAEVIGLGRSEMAARRAHPGIGWIFCDMAVQTVADWRRHLTDVSVVVNAAGALQDGARDSLHAIHDSTIANLCAAARGSDLRIIQISAAGVSPEASTEFFRSKARGDAHVRASGLDWTVLRPTLVIGRTAYGGASLLRGVAGLPMIGVRVFDACPVQAVALEELAGAVADCTEGRMPSRQSYDLTEQPVRGFGETVALFRNWLGFAPFAWRVPVPPVAMRLAGWGADALGWLGWRSPLRTSALQSIADGVTGDPSGWLAAGGRAFTPLPEVLANTPATLQERWFARLYPMMPLVIATLSLFWLVSGLVGLWQFGRAAEMLTTRGLPDGLAGLVVGGGAIADIALGALVLYRPWAVRACLAMVVVSLGYMAGAAVIAPDLWADPAGPMVKVIPAMVLALLCAGMLEER